MFCDLFARLLLNRAISVCESDTQGAVGYLHAATKTLMFEREVHDQIPLARVHQRVWQVCHKLNVPALFAVGADLRDLGPRPFFTKKASSLYNRVEVGLPLYLMSSSACTPLVLADACRVKCSYNCWRL